MDGSGWRLMHGLSILILAEEISNHDAVYVLMNVSTD